jgi:hypothetical protein
MLSVRIVESHVIVSNIKILSGAQKCFYGKFMSLATIKYTEALI